MKPKIQQLWILKKTLGRARSLLVMFTILLVMKIWEGIFLSKPSPCTRYYCPVYIHANQNSEGNLSKYCASIQEVVYVGTNEKMRFGIQL